MLLNTDACQFCSRMIPGGWPILLFPPAIHNVVPPA
jgi:hypothetical protein